MRVFELTHSAHRDGYFHYPKPDNFDDVCRLINVDVALAWTTFGLTCPQMVVVYFFAMYTLLYLDQEVSSARHQPSLRKS